MKATEFEYNNLLDNSTADMAKLMFKFRCWMADFDENITGALGPRQYNLCWLLDMKLWNEEMNQLKLSDHEANITKWKAFHLGASVNSLIYKLYSQLLIIYIWCVSKPDSIFRILFPFGPS